MKERILTFAFHQTGDCTAGAWAFAFPFPTRLLGVKHSGTGTSKDSTFAIGGGATIAATTIANGADPTYTAPDTEPDYVAAGTAYTLTLATSTDIDDPMLIFFFGVGEGGSNFSELGERIVCVPIYQTGNATTAAWVVEFPFPTKFLGYYGCGSNTATSTLAISGGAVDAAAELGDGGTPSWASPTTEPDYVDADTAITVTLTQTGSRHDDPMALLFFAVGEGGGNFTGHGELVQCVSLLQTGDATTGEWVYEFPFACQYLGHKGCASATSATTITLADGAEDAAAAIGTSGDPNWLTPTTTPDYVDADTAITVTLTQSGTRGDDPLVLSFIQIGEGGEA